MLKNKKGITLVALIVTIIILLILAGVTIAQLTENGLFEKAKEAEKKTENAQIKEQETLADYESKIDEYVNGTRENITIDKEEYNKLVSRIDELEKKSDSSDLLSRLEALESKDGSTEGIGEYFISEFSNASVTSGKANVVCSLTLPAGKYVMLGKANYRGADFRYHVSLGDSALSAYDNTGYVGMSISEIANIETEKTFNLTVWGSKNVTLSGGFIKAIRIAD